MDVDNIVGYDTVLELRRVLHEVSDKIIPVWHKNRGIKDFKKMCEDYSYISIASAKKDDIKDSQLKYFVDYAHKHNTKIHGLGCTRKKVLETVPFDSVDSSSWIFPVKYAHFDYKKRIKSDWLKNNNLTVLEYSYITWMKKQEYYYKKWDNYSNKRRG